MTNRRGFFGKLLVGAIAAWLGPKVVKAEPVPANAFRALENVRTQGYEVIYHDLTWLPSKGGIYFYDSKTGKRTPVSPFPPTPENE